MFRNTATYPEACNYSFRDEETDSNTVRGFGNKENMECYVNGGNT